MVWTVTSTLASVVAAVAALVTVKLTIGYREDERRRALGDALITIISSNQMGSNEGVVAGLLEVERVGALWLLGLGTGVDDAILELMDPAVRTDPELAFAVATRAFRAMVDCGAWSAIKLALRLLHGETAAALPQSGSRS